MLEPAVRWIKQSERGVPPQRAPRLLRPMAKMFSGREREGFRLGQAWQTHRAIAEPTNQMGSEQKLLLSLVKNQTDLQPTMAELAHEVTTSLTRATRRCASSIRLTTATRRPLMPVTAA